MNQVDIDRPFYGLGMNSPHIIGTIWYGQNARPDTIYSLLIDNVWQSLVIVSVGAITGCAITFVAIDKLGRRNIQLIGFFWLFILFLIIGGSFHHLFDVGGSSAIIVLYILCQIFFNFGRSMPLRCSRSRANCPEGPNTTSYIVYPLFHVPFTCFLLIATVTSRIISNPLQGTLPWGICCFWEAGLSHRPGISCLHQLWPWNKL